MSLIRLTRKSLKRKLMFMIILIILIVVVPIGLFIYYDSSHVIEEDVEKSSLQILKQTNLNLNRYYMEYEQFLFRLISSKEFNNWLQSDVHSYNYIHYYRSMIDQYIQPFLYHRSELLSVTFYNENGNTLYYNASSDINDGELSLDEAMLTENLTLGQSNVFVSLYTNKNIEIPVMTIVKKVRTGNRTGYIQADFSLRPTQEILQNINLGNEGIGIMSDANGNIIAHPHEHLYMSSLDDDIVTELNDATQGSFIRDETNEMIIFQTIPYTNWKTLVRVPYQDVARSIYRVRDAIVMITMVSVIIGTLLAVFLSTSITKRIHRLRQTIKKTEQGDFNQRVIVDGEDEVTDLAHAYNHMLEHIEASTNQLAKTKLVQQEAVLSALQSQINSHFLYNTLESINSLANLSDHKEIEQMTISLSNMLRYTSDYKDTIVTIRQEVHHLMDYLKIIQIRYGGNVTYHIKVEQECEDVPCLKAILQPIVENSIKHGIDLTGIPVCIDVKVQKYYENYVQIKIEDNGKGFNEASLIELKDQLKEVDLQNKYHDMNRVGILNVHYRLKTFFSEEQVHIDVGNRRDHEGAFVLLTFPIL